MARFDWSLFLVLVEQWTARRRAERRFPPHIPPPTARFLAARKESCGFFFANPLPSHALRSRHGSDADGEEAPGAQARGQQALGGPPLRLGQCCRRRPSKREGSLSAALDHSRN